MRFTTILLVYFGIDSARNLLLHGITDLLRHVLGRTLIVRVEGQISNLNNLIFHAILHDGWFQFKLVFHTSIISPFLT